jgi:hypothetical protein
MWVEDLNMCGSWIFMEKNFLADLNAIFWFSQKENENFKFLSFLLETEPLYRSVSGLAAKQIAIFGIFVSQLLYLA